ncbi:MAG: hypothetical protein OXM55_00775 [Bdellovibrionales bacterium]|nr:hypothetical protein [Bdellovibrionales bacterium]
MYENTISILSGSSISSGLFFDFSAKFPSEKEEDIDENKIYLPIPYSEINSIFEKFHDIDFLNAKFDELKEKEIDNKITDFEQFLLYDILEKRILEFPNPYLPSDHEKGMAIIKRYNLIEEKEPERKNNNGTKKKSWFNLFSWLN